MSQLPVYSAQPGIPVNGDPAYHLAPVQVEDHWKTELFACLEDGESCWWGTWCCCIVSARNAQSFDIGKPVNRILSFVAILIFGVALIIIFQSILLLFLGLGLYAGYQANSRQAIRTKLNIRGDYMSDLVQHTFCTCCSVCQESREAKKRKMKNYDLCCGDPLESLSITACLSDTTSPSDDSPTPNPMQNTIDFAHEPEPLTRSLNPNGSSPRVPTTQDVTFKDQCGKLSTTGRFIAYMWMVLGVVGLIVMSASQHPLTIFVMILVFLQPVAILYFIYWRNFREYASVDYVVKLFTIGFFLSTTQSIVFESILQWLLSIFINITVSIEEYIQGSTSFVGDGVGGGGVEALLSVIASFRQKGVSASLLAPTHGSFRFIALQTGFQFTSVLTSMYSSSSVKPDATHGFGLMAADDMGGVTSNTGDDTTSNDDDGMVDFDTKKHIVVVVIALFLMAFVVAAGVEETMKHFAVHCYQFPGRLKDPRTILVFLLTAALGFETAENIEYVFGSSISPVRQHHLVVNELFVLSMRQAMPIHAICAVLQATEYSKVMLGTAFSNHTFFVLLPAIILHGSFDFFLFLIGALAQAYNVESVAFDVMSIVIPVLLTVGGLYWAYSGFTKVLKGPGGSGERQWSRVSESEDAIDL
jgi:Cys-rich protein (TIGR01571 family)